MVGHLRRRAGCLLRRDEPAAPAIGRDHRQGPGCRDLGRLGRRRRRADGQYRAVLHHAEAALRAGGQRRSGDRTAAAADRRRSKARGCSFRRRRTSVSAGGSSRSQYQYTLQDADLDELNEWAPKVLTQLRKLPELARRVHRPADQRHDRHADDRPRSGVALRHPAATDRRHAVRRVRPAADRAVSSPRSTATMSSWRCCRSFKG